MTSKNKDRVCETRSIRLYNLPRNSIERLRLKQIINLTKWLSDACHCENANSVAIIKGFLKKSRIIRGGLL